MINNVDVKGSIKMSIFQRSELLLGAESIEKLRNSHVVIVGLGGVGSYAVEAIARAGVGKLTLIDGDVVQPSNINRQLPALHSTVNMSKAQLMKARCMDINPECEVVALEQFLNPDDIDDVIPLTADFVMDCIDSIAPKLSIIVKCRKNKLPIISSMGAGGKLDPSKIKISDINKTRQCVFSKDVRKRLRKMQMSYGLKVVYSDEAVSKKHMELTHDTMYKKSYYGTISYMPAMFGLTMASYVIRKLIHNNEIQEE